MMKSNCILILNLFVFVILTFRNELPLYQMGTIFLVHNYSVIKILRKIRATTFTENYGKLREWGMSAWDERTLLPISLDNAILYPFSTS